MSQNGTKIEKVLNLMLLANDQAGKPEGELAGNLAQDIIEKYGLVDELIKLLGLETEPAPQSPSAKKETTIVTATNCSVGKKPRARCARCGDVEKPDELVPDYDNLFGGDICWDCRIGVYMEPFDDCTDLPGSIKRQIMSKLPLDANVSYSEVCYQTLKDFGISDDEYCGSF